MWEGTKIYRYAPAILGCGSTWMARVLGAAYELIHNAPCN